jgi:hypothetical protein
VCRCWRRVASRTARPRRSVDARRAGRADRHPVPRHARGERPGTFEGTSSSTASEARRWRASSLRRRPRVRWPGSMVRPSGTPLLTGGRSVSRTGARRGADPPSLEAALLAGDFVLAGRRRD